MPDPFLDNLSPEETDTFQWIDKHMVALIQDGVVPEQSLREQLIQALESLSERHPYAPRLFNFIGVLLQIDAPLERVQQRAIEGFQRFPDYVFAFCDYVRLMIQRQRFDEAERVIAGRYTIDQFRPDRDVFHQSEVLTWHFTIGSLMCVTDRFDMAKAHLGVLERLDPDGQRTIRLRNSLQYSSTIGSFQTEFRRLFQSLKSARP